MQGSGGETGKKGTLSLPNIDAWVSRRFLFDVAGMESLSVKVVVSVAVEEESIQRSSSIRSSWAQSSG